MRLFILILLAILACVKPGTAGRCGVLMVGINDPVTPVTASFLHRNLEESARRGDCLALIEMDTPGGLDTAMREIIKDIFASPTPVAVYVSPSGARAASAGAIICLAADVCAMAPGTNIGAAHPVSLSEKNGPTMAAKQVNDAEAYVEGIARQRGRDEAVARRMVRDSMSLSADRALAGRVIDLIARDRGELLQRLEGRTIRHAGRDVVLRLADAKVESVKMGGVERVLSVISNPNVAYVLMMIGMMGIFFELSNPGVILPGVIGGISLIMAFFAFQTLPVNYAGMLLILLALVLFIAEIKIVSHGMLTVGGIIAMLLGSMMLFEFPQSDLRVSWSVILITVLSTAGFFTIVVAKALAVHRRRPTTGREGLIGEEGFAETGIDSSGKVFVRGEYWDATSDGPISAGSRVSVELVEGMRLRVRKVGNL